MRKQSQLEKANGYIATKEAMQNFDDFNKSYSFINKKF